MRSISHASPHMSFFTQTGNPVNAAISFQLTQGVEGGGMIAMGAQIRAARALLDWNRSQLAQASGLHKNAVAY